MDMKILLALLLTVVASKFTIAQDSIVNKSQNTIFEEVVIQGNRIQIPFSEENRDIVVLDAKVIETLPVNSLNELLGFVSGVDIRQRSPWGGQADISINGGTFDQTLILLNGVKIIDPQTGHNMLNLPVTTDAIERIEIMKGAAASKYGINALNGVVNIVTKQPSKSGLIVRLNGGSSFEKDTSNNALYGAMGVNLSASLATKNSKHFISLSTLQSSGYRYNTAMNNNKLFYQNQFKLGEQGVLQFTGGFVYNAFGANGFYAAPADVESEEKLNTGIAALQGSFRVNKVWKIKPSISYRYNYDDYVFVRQDPSIYQNLHTTNVIDVEVNNSIHTAIGIVGIGIEYRNEWINSNSLGEWNRDNYGLYAEYSFSKVKNLNINIGAYLNYSQFFDWQVLPSIDLGYQLAPSWRLFANAGTGTRVPTYTDWYYKGPNNIGNSQLEPENAFHTEGGVKLDKKGLKVSASFFYRITNNMIDWVKDSIAAPWQTHNFQKVKTTGISFSADYRLLKPKNAKGLSVLAGLSYTWLNPKIQKQTDDEFSFSHYALENLKNQLVARINLGFLKHYNVGLTGRYDQRVNYKDYFIVDAKVAGQWGDFEVNITANNLTNITYIEAGAFPLPGRWMSVGLKWQFWGE